MCAKFYVAVTDYVVDDLETEHEILGDLADIEAIDAKTETDLLAYADRTDAMMVYHTITISAPTFQRFESRRWSPAAAWVATIWTSPPPARRESTS